MTRHARLKRGFAGEFHAGMRIAGRLHVSASNLQVCRACWKALGKRSKALGRGRMRDARHALFIGALRAHKINRDLFIRWRF